MAHYEKVARRASQLIAQNFPQVNEIYLYGSVSKGTATSRSDIDLCCVLPLGEDKSLIKVGLVLDTGEEIAEFLKKNGLEATTNKGKDNAGKVHVYILLEEAKQVDGIGRNLEDAQLIYTKSKFRFIVGVLQTLFRR